MGGMVKGLLIQMTVSASGRFAPIARDKNTVAIVWIGSGMKAQKIPIPKANDTEFRFK